jgi:hypothetical protein
MADSARNAVGGVMAVFAVLPHGILDKISPLLGRSRRLTLSVILMLRDQK